MSERFFGCPKHGPVTDHANHCWCGYKPKWWVPDGDSARLRARTHEIAAEKDREKAELESRVARYERAFHEAREVVRDFRADWTTDPPSQRPDGFWRYASRATVEAMAAVVFRAREVEAKYRRRAQDAEDRAWAADRALRGLLDAIEEWFRGRDDDASAFDAAIESAEQAIEDNLRMER